VGVVLGARQRTGEVWLSSVQGSQRGHEGCQEAVVSNAIDHSRMPVSSPAVSHDNQPIENPPHSQAARCASVRSLVVFRKKQHSAGRNLRGPSVGEILLRGNVLGPAGLISSTRGGAAVSGCDSEGGEHRVRLSEQTMPRPRA